MSHISSDVTLQNFLRQAEDGTFPHSSAVTAPAEYHPEIIELISRKILGEYRPSHPDMLIIGTPENPPLIGDPQKPNYTGTCRWLKEELMLKPVESKYRLGIILSADALNTGAGNSLLKLTEEPPDYAFIIFMMEDSRLFLPTLQSRTQKIVIKPEQTAVTPKSPPMYMSAWSQWLNEKRSNLSGEELIIPDVEAWIEFAKEQENTELVYKLEQLRIILSRKNLSVPMQCDLVMMTIMEESGREVDYILDNIWKA